MKTFRCPAEMKFLGYRHEITKMSKFNVGHDSLNSGKRSLVFNNMQYISITINKILDILIAAR